jgi:hypothetical protein
VQADLHHEIGASRELRSAGDVRRLRLPRARARTHARARARTHARALQVWSSRRAEPAAALGVRRSPHLLPLPGLPHLCQDGRIAAICSGTGLTRPHPHRDWAVPALSPSCWRWMAAAYASVRTPSAHHSPHLTPSRLLPAQRNARTRERVPLGARRGRARDTLTRPAALKASMRRAGGPPHALLPSPGWRRPALGRPREPPGAHRTAPHSACLACRYEPIPRAAEFPPGVESVRSPRPARSRCRCGRGEPSPGADVAGVRTGECPRVPSNAPHVPAVLPGSAAPVTRSTTCPGLPMPLRVCTATAQACRAGLQSGAACAPPSTVTVWCLSALCPQMRSRSAALQHVVLGQVVCVATCCTGAGRLRCNMSYWGRSCKW